MSGIRVIQMLPYLFWAGLLAAAAEPDPHWYSAIARVDAKGRAVPGTAFVVAVKGSEAFLVTSAHVVAGDPAPVVRFRAGGKPFNAEVRSPELGDEKGLALLVIDNAPKNLIVLPGSDTEVGPGTQVTIAGYPASVAQFGVDDPRIFSTAKGTGVVVLNRDAEPGFSGGPVVFNGRTVGMVYGEDPGRGRAVAASRINTYLKDNDVAWIIARANSIDRLPYIWIPPGRFLMGCSRDASGGYDRDCFDDEKEAHMVTISRGFWIGQTEVTVAAYERFRSAVTPQPRRLWERDSQDHPINTAGDPNAPVVGLNSDEAKRYCAWAGMRLPSEAEWEYAARAEDPRPRYGDLNEIAWYMDNSSGRGPFPVAQKKPNAWNLYDTLGNVSEWVADWRDNPYQPDPVVDPHGPPFDRRAYPQLDPRAYPQEPPVEQGSLGGSRTTRGGPWNDGPKGVRVSFRGAWFAHDLLLGPSVGFRCAGDLP